MAGTVEAFAEQQGGMLCVLLLCVCSVRVLSIFRCLVIFILAG